MDLAPLDTIIRAATGEGGPLALLLIAEPYDVALVAVGIALLATALLPRLLEHRPLAMPIVVVLLGFAIFALPLGLEPPDPLGERDLAKRLTELGVSVALMGAGLKIERPPSLRGWTPVWLLLLVAMPITIAVAGVLAWWVAAWPRRAPPSSRLRSRRPTRSSRATWRRTGRRRATSPRAARRARSASP